MLAAAREGQRAPGRPKSEVQDCQWLQRWPTYGLRAAAFRPPEPVKRWAGTRDALHFGPSCPQPPFPESRLPGVELVGPFPGDLQQELVFTSAIAADTKEAEAAKALIDYLRTPAATALIKVAGMTPG